MHEIKAIVFDVDGTILDTREYIFRSFEHTLKKYGHSVPDRSTLQNTIAGKILEDCYPHFAPIGDVVALCNTHRNFQTNRFDLIEAYEGLPETLDKLRQRNIVSGVYSSRGKVTLRPSLEHAQVLKYFDAVIDGHDVRNHKPHPEGVLKVLELLDVQPKNSVMIGDTKSDIESGKTAGCAFTIGITHGLGTRKSLEDAGAGYIVESLKDVLPILEKTK